MSLSQISKSADLVGGTFLSKLVDKNHKIMLLLSRAIHSLKADHQALNISFHTNTRGIKFPKMHMGNCQNQLSGPIKLL